MKRLYSKVFPMLFSLILFGSINVFAAVPTVFLDGDQLDYYNVDPVIINDRVMVPIRETAEYMDLSIDWNADTSTMTFKNDKNTIRHTINENIIYIDGEGKNFDTTSIVLENRSLMPIRMLAEALGSKVDWDDETRSVIITSVSNSDPIVYSVELDKKEVSSGDSITITLMATTDTTSVRLTSSQNIVLATSNQYTNVGGYHQFVVNYTPTSTSATETIFVYAGDNSGYKNTADQMFMIVIGNSTSSSDLEIEILDYDIDDSSVDYGDTVKVTVYTDTNAKKVWIENPSEDVVASKTSYTKSSTKYEWSLSFTAKKSGSYYIYAENEDGDTDTMKFSLTVADDDDNNIEILSYTKSASTLDYGSYLDVTVYTETDATRVWIENSSGDEMSYTRSYAKKDGKYVWELSFRVYESGYYYIYSTDGSDEDKDSFYITISGDNDSDDVEITDYDISSTSVYSGDYVDITVYTETGATRVWVENSSGSQMDYTSSYSRSSGEYVWDLSFRAYDSGSYYIYSSNGSNEDYVRVTITVD